MTRRVLDLLGDGLLQMNEELDVQGLGVHQALVGLQLKNDQ